MDSATRRSPRSPASRELTASYVERRFGRRRGRFQESPKRFDILPLLVCTDGAVSKFGRDVRRLRPNLMIGGVAAAAERRWTGDIRLPSGLFVGSGSSTAGLPASLAEGMPATESSVWARSR
jgi:hypothetical protein